MHQKRPSYIGCLAVLGIIIFTCLASCATEESAYGSQIKRTDYEISRDKVIRDVEQGRIFTDFLSITNLKDSSLTVSVSVSESIKDILKFSQTGVIIEGKNFEQLDFTMAGKDIGNFVGTIDFSGDLSESIPVNITIVNKTLHPLVLVTVELANKKVSLGRSIQAHIDIKKLLDTVVKNITLNYSLMDKETNQTYYLGSDEKQVRGSFQLLKSLPLPPQIIEKEYILQIQSEYDGKTSHAAADVTVVRPFLLRKLFGIPLWLIILLFTLIVCGIAARIITKRIIESRKKYKMMLYKETLPKKSPETFYFGKVAETNIQSYYDMNLFTTHGVVAGATGGGKSISAQVIVEEALMKNIAVVVFDPTAQWSGMLRKCEDKKMLSLYPKFGLKPTDARAFPGNLKMIKNARQSIDIKKYITPGQIQIFAMNKLDPSDIDKFVESAIISIFRSGPEEHPGLRVMLVFDEVHRLLPKFGGSGKGFLQIERACREFRKWGFGILLVSQVLSDFVGEIKANINTELQMRTRDESDLNRIKTKYGEEFLQSLIKASIGTGMFVNPKYNKGKPFFIQFRPILHNTRRLSDDILEKYNAYSEVIEDLEYQIEQLDAEKVDTFDMKMELKLVKDKLMTGNFTVVDIYLEGLKPRFEKQWQVLGKTPKKLKLQLLEEKDVAALAALAQKEKADWEKENTVVEKKEEKKEDKKKKIVKPIILDNGATISSLQELQDFLPTLEQEIFNFHVNKDKNDLAVWITKEIDTQLGAIIAPLRDKKSIIDALVNYPANVAVASLEAVKEATKEEKEDKKKEKTKVKEKEDKKEQVKIDNKDSNEVKKEVKEVKIEEKKDIKENPGEKKEKEEKKEEVKTENKPEVKEDNKDVKQEKVDEVKKEEIKGEKKKEKEDKKEEVKTDKPEVKEDNKDVKQEKVDEKKQEVKSDKVVSKEDNKEVKKEEIKQVVNVEATEGQKAPVVEAPKEEKKETK